jgi:tRNA dimethylallyltransferase
MRTPSPAPPLLVLVGPTAAGKTDLALAVAERLPVEILVADSRQVYRGMDIGTAKPDAAARRRVPHHLLDLVAPDEPFTLADWLAAARSTIRAVGERGRVPLVVGGTGLYVTALIRGYALGGQPPDPALRAQLAGQLEAEGLERFAARLTSMDPAAASTTDLANPRRVMRALERSLGGNGGNEARGYPGALRLVGLRRPRPVLDERIRGRARAMFARGLLEEVARLLAAGYDPELRPFASHGYREAIAHLAGESTLEEAIASTVLRTRQYAKRQATWWRREPAIHWLDVEDGAADAPPTLAAALVAMGE